MSVVKPSAAGGVKIRFLAPCNVCCAASRPSLAPLAAAGCAMGLRGRPDSGGILDRGRRRNCDDDCSAGNPRFVLLQVSTAAPPNALTLKTHDAALM